MTDAALGEFIKLTFMPFVPILAGGVLGLTLVIIVLVLFKEFLPKV